MAAPGGAKVRASGAELNQLIAEVGAWLRGGGDSSMDGSGATQADAHAAQFVAKLRAILPRLLDALLDPERGAWFSQNTPCAVSSRVSRALRARSLHCRSA
jgi:hypothetical protein